MSHAPRAYSYLRCSTPEQMRGDSFRRQSEAAARYARENGLVLDDTLDLRDQGVSAFKGANREAGLGRFLAAVEAGLVPVGSFLLVENLDRISRQTVLRALGLLQEIVQTGVTVVTLSDRALYSVETLDRNPTALLMALIVMIRAHEESQMKSERIARAWEGKRQRAKASREAMTRRCPAWIRIEDGRYVEIPERAGIVREIYRMAIEGRGKRAIVAEIRRRGILPWGRGKVWQESYVEKILKAEAVFGRFAPLKGRVAPIDGYFPVTVSEETYWSAQAARSNRRTSRNPVPPGKGNNLFSGLARCGCGAGMHYVDKGERSSGPYLICGNYRTGGTCKNGLRWIYQIMEREIVYFATLAPTPSFRPDEGVRSSSADELIAARERYEVATLKLNALADAIAAGAGASLAAAHAAADLDLAKAKMQLASAETAARVAQPARPPLVDEMYEILWSDNPPTDDPEWRRATAATLRRHIDRLEFREDRIMAIIYRAEDQNHALIPFDNLHCRLPGEIVVETNAGWWDGKRDPTGKPTKRGHRSTVSTLAADAGGEERRPD